MRKINIILLSTILFTVQVKSQVGIIKDLLNVPLESTEAFILKQGINDAEILIEGYMEPLGKSLGAGLNAGWYNTGKPHNFPGFDITFGGHMIILPSASKTFSPDLSSGITAEGLPTINGPKDGGIIYVDEDIYSQFGFSSEDNEEIGLIQSPGGGDWNNFFMPYLQASIGLVYKTELLLRYMPPITYSNMETNYWGIGIKHDFKQHMPVIGDLPFDASFLAAYSRLKSGYEYDADKSIDFDVQAFNCNMILSKKVAILTAYAGVGYQHSAANLLFDGLWSYRDENFSLISQESPINLSLGGVNGFKANFGARIKLLLFTLHADYTFADYNIFTIGLGLNSDIGSKMIGGAIGK